MKKEKLPKALYNSCENEVQTFVSHDGYRDEYLVNDKGSIVHRN